MASENDIEKPRPVVSEEEIERIIKELEKKEEERRRRFDAERKRLELEEKKEKVPEQKQTEVQKPILVPPPLPPPEPPAVRTPSLPPKMPEELPTKHPFKTFFKYFFLFIFVFALFYFGLNYRSYIIKIKYIYYTDIKGKAPSTTFNLPEIPEKNEVNLPDSIIIPKIQLQVPIVWQVEQQDILKELKNGVVHLKGTSLPDEDGNTAIFGHSSNYPWEKGMYDQAFALLDILTPKDKILIVYKRKKYFYEVADKEIVKPEDVHILDSKAAQLTLITCWPVGTSFRRIVIRANQTERPPKATPGVFLPISP